MNITLNGDWTAPIHQRSFAPGDELCGLVVLPGSSTDAFYMLRVSEGNSTLPDQTLLWSSPAWVDVDSGGGYPVAQIEADGGGAGGPVALTLVFTDPDGRQDLADVTLHVALDADALGTAPLPLLLAWGGLQPVPDGWSITLPGLLLPPGNWSLVLEVHDQDGRLAVAETGLQLLP